MAEHIFDFIGGTSGAWKVLKIDKVIGDTLEPVSHVDIKLSDTTKSNIGVWTLKGLRSNIRYTTKKEQEQLLSIQAGLGRPEATCAALIPIRKSPEWWALAQDERRKIFEEQSHHIKIGLDYLPPIARRLHHCRDIDEAFDFLTWFEYAPIHSEAFEELVHILRQTEEWNYIDREVDIRLVRS